MATQAVTQVTCPNCNHTFTAPLAQIIDAQKDPEAKMRLLAGQLNAIMCPHCGFQGLLNTPFVYHDPDLELAFVYTPMDMGGTNLDQQKLVGNLTNRLLTSLPPEERKGYLLQPQMFLTQKSLVDAILENDEETRELVEAQERRAELVEQLRQIAPDDRLALAGFVGQNDKELDEMFFQLLGLMQSMLNSQGQSADYERLAQHQEYLMLHTTLGQALQAQEQAVRSLTENPTREMLLNQLVKAEDESVRRALVAAGRQLLDYAFFQALTKRVEDASDEGQREKLLTLRKEILEVRDQVDAMTLAVLDSRAKLLHELLIAENPRDFLLRHLSELDAAFFSVLNANIRRAHEEERQDIVEQLQTVGDMVNELLSQIAPPEIKFINQLLDAEDEDAVRQLLEQARELASEQMMALLERAGEDLEADGREQDAQRLRYAAEQMQAWVAA